MTTIRRWWMIAPAWSTALGRFSASRSGEPSKDDQLTLMVMISPNRADRASINSGNSRATEAVCGHHAPSRGEPSLAAKASRTGLARRRPCTAPFTVLTSSRPQRQAQRRQENRRARAFPNRLSSTESAPPRGNPSLNFGSPSTILHLGLTRHTNVRIHKRTQSQMFKFGCGPIRGSALASNRSPLTLHSACGNRAGSAASRQNCVNPAAFLRRPGTAEPSNQRPCEIQGAKRRVAHQDGRLSSGHACTSLSVLLLRGMFFVHPFFEMREVEKYGTGNCEMV